MMNRPKVWMLLVLVLSACGGSTSGETDLAVATLVAEGIQRGVAECVVETVVGDGLDPNEVVDQTIDASVAVLESMGQCLNDEALVELLGVTNVDEVRAVLASKFSTDSPLTTSQAFCIIETVEGEGFNLADIGGYTAGSSDAEGVVASLESAQASCTAE